jgi:hypothetical protein
MRTLASIFFAATISQTGAMGAYGGVIWLLTLVAFYEDFLTVRNKR